MGDARFTDGAARQNVIICGVSRSGTSLVHSMIGSHSRVSALRETHVLRRYSANRRFCRWARRSGSAESADKILLDTYLEREPVLRDELVCAILQGLPAEKWYTFLLDRAGTELPHISTIVDKDPRYLDFLAWLHKRESDAHFVVMVRGAADVVASKQSVAWASHRSGLTNALVGWAQTCNLLETLSRFPSLGARSLLVSYASLIEAPEDVLGKIFDGLSIDGPVPAARAWQTTAESLTAFDEQEWKDRTSLPVTQRQASRSGKQTIIVSRLNSWLGQLQDEVDSTVAAGGGVSLAGDLDLPKLGWVSKRIGRSYQFLVSTGYLVNRGEVKLGG